MGTMENITAEYLTRAEIWLLITTFLYFLMNGAQIFETAVFVPKWTVNPPETLKLLADKNGASLKTFWIILHSLHELTFIAAIIFCWKLGPIRNWLVILFLIHFAVRIWTILYFAPNIIDFQRISETSGFDTNLLNRVTIWQKFNYLRVWLFIAISIGLIPLCIKILGLKGC
jgi:hypothetical protein